MRLATRCAFRSLEMGRVGQADIGQTQRHSLSGHADLVPLQLVDHRQGRLHGAASRLDALEIFDQAGASGDQVGVLRQRYLLGEIVSASQCFEGSMGTRGFLDLPCGAVYPAQVVKHSARAVSLTDGVEQPLVDHWRVLSRRLSPPGMLATSQAASIARRVAQAFVGRDDRCADKTPHWAPATTTTVWRSSAVLRNIPSWNRGPNGDCQARP